jgi:hypothetical protein
MEEKKFFKDLSLNVSIKSSSKSNNESFIKELTYMINKLIMEEISENDKIEIVSHNIKIFPND